MIRSGTTAISERAHRRLIALAAALMLCACSSAPVHYYTLVPAARLVPAAQASAAGAPAPFQFQLMPVHIPAQVDQPQLVVRQNGPAIAMLESERWIAPLGDEIRSAVAADLTHDLGAHEAAGGRADGRPLLQIMLDVRRFDSLPGQYALINAAWTLQMNGATNSQAALACTSQIREPVGAGYDALVQGHQQALARLSAQIATAARSVAAGTAGVCPEA